MNIPFDYLQTFSNLFSIDDEIVIFDIGANDGSISSEFLNCFPKASIVAFEPGSEAFDLLFARLGSNSQVRLEKFGLSDRNGKSTLFVSDHNRFRDSSLLGINNKSKSIERDLHPKSAFKSATFTEEFVDVITLDNYIELNTEILEKLKLVNSILKIDTQGNDLNVLKGSINALKESLISAVMLEVILDDVYLIAKESVPAIFSLLYSFDYVLFDVSHIYKDLKRARTLWMNLIFVHETLI